MTAANDNEDRPSALGCQAAVAIALALWIVILALLHAAGTI